MAKTPCNGGSKTVKLSWNLPKQLKQRSFQIIEYFKPLQIDLFIMFSLWHILTIMKSCSAAMELW